MQPPHQARDAPHRLACMSGPPALAKEGQQHGEPRGNHPRDRPGPQARNCTCAGLRPRPQEKKGRGLQFQQPLVRGPPAGTPEGTIGGWYGWPAPRRGWLDHADEILSLSPVGLRRRTGLLDRRKLAQGPKNRVESPKRNQTAAPAVPSAACRSAAAIPTPASPQGRGARLQGVFKKLVFK